MTNLILTQNVLQKTDGDDTVDMNEDEELHTSGMCHGYYILNVVVYVFKYDSVCRVWATADVEL